MTTSPIKNDKIEKAIDQVFLNRIKYVGDGEFVFHGTPIELIKETAAIFPSLIMAIVEESLPPDATEYLNELRNDLGMDGADYGEIVDAETYGKAGFNSCRSTFLTSLKGRLGL
jgi:hypothetical protein